MKSRRQARVAGIDGCRGGWLALRLEAASGRVLGLEMAAAWSELSLDDVAVIGVDMPVGLADAGPRACDRAARTLLPTGRKSSVFPPPRRYMLGYRRWAEANGAGRAREGVGIARQSWNITGKIAELDAALTPAEQARVFEVHPELVFHRLNGWAPLPRKKSAAGREVRGELLWHAGVSDLDTFVEGRDRSRVAADDVLDAAACALAARRILNGEARRVPTAPPRDGRELRMEIWF